MSTMTPRQRVLAALRRETPDRVPWVEDGVETGLQIAIMGSENFEPADLCRKLGMDAFGYYFPKRVPGQPPISPTDTKAFFYYPQTINFDFVPPWIADMGIDQETGRAFVKKGLLTSRDALGLFEEFLPDPDHPAHYRKAEEWLKQYRQEFAVFARVRLGSTNTLESMGVDIFSYMLYDDPGLIDEIHRRFSQWSARVIRNLNDLDFDFYWINDDLAFNSGPFMSPRVFRELFLPNLAIAAQEIRKPWVFHSDGDLFPLLPDLLTLGMSAIHPIQPSCMDIGRMKREYGEKVCLIGNIDLDRTLTIATAEEVEAEVREKIRIAAPGGGYMISSANSLTNYCKVENVLAMADAVRKYGAYE